MVTSPTPSFGFSNGPGLSSTFPLQRLMPSGSLPRSRSCHFRAAEGSEDKSRARRNVKVSAGPAGWINHITVAGVGPPEVQANRARFEDWLPEGGEQPSPEGTAKKGVDI